MKYSFLINGLIGGGTEKICKLLANSFADKGHSINLYVFDNDRGVDFGFHNNVKVIFLGKKNSLRSFRVLAKLIPSIQTSSILVFNHELALSLLFAKSITRSNLKIISRMNNTFSKTIKFKRFTYRVVVNALMKLFYRHMDHYIFQSEGIKRDLTVNYGVNGASNLISNPIVIPNSTSDFIKSRSRLLYVGRLVKQKNVMDLLDVMKMINISHPLLTLTIVGDGPERKVLESYAQRCGLDKQVNFIGETKSVSQYYIESDLTLLSSFNEGFPNVLLESIAYGTPVVSYDCPSGPSEIIENGVNGFLVKHLNKSDFKDKVVEGLTHDWNLESLVKSIHRYKSENITSEYEMVLNKYES